MTLGATMRKLVESSEPGTISLWKRLHTTAIAIAQVLPEPVAILKAKRRRSFGGNSCTPSAFSSGMKRRSRRAPSIPVSKEMFFDTKSL